MDAFLNFLPASLRPYAKFVYPAALSVLGTIIYAIVNGNLDKHELELGLVGLVAATVSFIVANGPTGLRRYAKALAPALLTIVGVAIHFLVTGEWNATEAVAAFAGLVASLVTFLVPNAVETVPAPATPTPEGTRASW